MTRTDRQLLIASTTQALADLRAGTATLQRALEASQHGVTAMTTTTVTTLRTFPTTLATTARFSRDATLRTPRAARHYLPGDRLTVGAIVATCLGMAWQAWRGAARALLG